MSTKKKKEKCCVDQHNQPNLVGGQVNIEENQLKIN